MKSDVYFVNVFQAFEVNSDVNLSGNLRKFCKFQLVTSSNIFGGNIILNSLVAIIGRTFYGKFSN